MERDYFLQTSLYKSVVPYRRETGGSGGFIGSCQLELPSDRGYAGFDSPSARCSLGTAYSVIGPA